MTKIREFAFGVVDSCALTEGMMNKAAMTRIMLERYTAMGCRLYDFFNTAVAEDWSIAWELHGPFALGRPDEQGRIHEVVHISGAKAPVGPHGLLF